MKTHLKVSTVMSVYNGLPYLDEAVESVLGQTFEDFEFIIIDDGSTDGSTEVLRRYAARDERVRLVVQENRGLTSSLNRGIDLAKGEYIARMDADDVCLPERFARQVDYLDNHPECVLIGGEAVMIDEKGHPLSNSHPLFSKRGISNADFCYRHNAIEERLLTGGWAFVHPTVMMRKAAIEKVGGYNRKIKDAEDRDLFIRLAEVGNVANLSSAVLKYRCHSTQVSTTSPIQNYWSKRARRSGYKRRGLPLPDELRLPAMVRSAIGKELRQTSFWPRVLKMYNQMFG